VFFVRCLEVRCDQTEGVFIRGEKLKHTHLSHNQLCLQATDEDAWFQAFDARELRTALFWVITQRLVVISYRRFGTTFGSHLQASRISSTDDGILGRSYIIRKFFRRYSEDWLGNKQRKKYVCFSIKIMENKVTVDRLVRPWRLLTVFQEIYSILHGAESFLQNLTFSQLVKKYSRL
jgi:hypothetical protein